MQLNRSSDDILRPIRFGQLLFFSFIVSYGYPVKIAKRPLVLVANNRRELMKKFNIKL